MLVGRIGVGSVNFGIKDICWYKGYMLIGRIYVGRRIYVVMKDMCWYEGYMLVGRIRVCRIDKSLFEVGIYEFFFMS